MYLGMFSDARVENGCQAYDHDHKTYATNMELQLVALSARRILTFVVMRNDELENVTKLCGRVVTIPSNLSREWETCSVTQTLT